MYIDFFVGNLMLSWAAESRFLPYFQHDNNQFPELLRFFTRWNCIQFSLFSAQYFWLKLFWIWYCFLEERYVIIENYFKIIPIYKISLHMTKLDMKMCSLEFFETIHGVSIYDNYGYWVLNWILERKKKSWKWVTMLF